MNEYSTKFSSNCTWICGNKLFILNTNICENSGNSFFYKNFYAWKYYKLYSHQSMGGVKKEGAERKKTSEEVGDLTEP